MVKSTEDISVCLSYKKAKTRELRRESIALKSNQVGSAGGTRNLAHYTPAVHIVLSIKQTNFDLEDAFLFTYWRNSSEVVFGMSCVVLCLRNE